MTADALSVTHVDLDRTDSSSITTDVTPKVLDPATVVDWRGFSFDFLNGLEIRAHSDSNVEALLPRRDIHVGRVALDVGADRDDPRRQGLSPRPEKL